MDEAGDPTPKYYALREIIGEYFSLDGIPLPQKEPKMSIGTVQLHPINILSSNVCRQQMGTVPVRSTSPMTFEALNQYSGLVLYEADLPVFVRDPSILKIDGIRDRAYIYADQVSVKNLIWVDSMNSPAKFFRISLAFYREKITLTRFQLMQLPENDYRYS